MAARDVVMARQHEAITELRNVIERHSPETAEQLRLLSYGGSVPNSVKSPDLFATYLAESINVLAGVVDELVEERRPKRRGRPRQNDEK